MKTYGLSVSSTEMLKTCYALGRGSPRAYDVRQEGWASRALSGALLFLP